MSEERFDRHLPFFAEEGQKKLRSTTVAVIGVGGVGTHVVQQLALLGVGGLNVVDKEELSESNRNRYVGARYDDPIPGSPKVNLAERLVQSVDPSITVRKVQKGFISEDGFAAIKDADYVFGCLDCEGARLVLTELCSAYLKPYFDLASDIIPGEKPNYGGRVCVAWDGTGCLVCLGIVDMAEARRDLSGPNARKDHEAIYGIERDFLGQRGPSVVSINGVVASLGVTEFMVARTGIRAPKPILKYYGELGRKITIPTDTPEPDCYYCKAIRGQKGKADAERYIREGVGHWL